MTDVTYLFDRSVRQGRIEFTDRDRLDLLHRMSTNDMLALQPGQGASTVLTTALARIIDRLIVYNRGETALVVANYPEKVRKWLGRHIFFQDKVKMRDVSAELGQLEIHGPGAAAALKSAGLDTPDLPLHHFREQTIFDATVMAACTYPLYGQGYSLIAPLAALGQIRERLVAAGVLVGDDAAYERLRIRAGLPGADHELTEDYIPLEANAWDSVSFRKGCYIGQEIIARMESRNKLAKTLVGLRLAEDAEPGARLVADSQAVGTLTSATDGDAAEPNRIGLGFVKPDFAVAGTRLTVESETGGAAPAEVIALPLIQERH